MNNRKVEPIILPEENDDEWPFKPRKDDAIAGFTNALYYSIANLNYIPWVIQERCVNHYLTVSEWKNGYQDRFDSVEHYYTTIAFGMAFANVDIEEIMYGKKLK